MTIGLLYDPRRIVLAFDITTTGFRHWWLVAAAFIPVVVGIALIAYGLRRSPSPSHRRSRPAVLSGSVLAVLGAVATALVATNMYREHQMLTAAVRSGNYRVVEGIVTDFIPADLFRNREETFEVGGHPYHYRFWTITEGYNGPLFRRSPIHDGLWARVADVHGKIVRLEIANP
jgi:hypothetical protein